MVVVAVVLVAVGPVWTDHGVVVGAASGVVVVVPAAALVVVVSAAVVVVDVVEVVAGPADAAVVLRVPTVRKTPAAMAFRADDGRNAFRRR